jgi:Fur family transcriptional regulator, ferric uptake regulator
MREFLKTKGFKMTQQRELIFRSFFELGEHVSVDELYDRVRKVDRSVGYSTVWRNLKLICRVGLAQEVNVGDGVTRYDRVTRAPHGHLYCLRCKKLVEIALADLIGPLEALSQQHQFTPDDYKVEVRGYCDSCQKERDREFRAKKVH